MATRRWRATQQAGDREESRALSVTPHRPSSRFLRRPPEQRDDLQTCNAPAVINAAGPRSHQVVAQTQQT